MTVKNYLKESLSTILCKIIQGEGSSGKGSVLEFQQNEPQNQQKIVTPMNNKVAAISKIMELPGDK